MGWDAGIPSAADVLLLGAICLVGACKPRQAVHTGCHRQGYAANPTRHFISLPICLPAHLPGAAWCCLQEEAASSYTAAGCQDLLQAMLHLDAQRLQACLALPPPAQDGSADVPKQVGCSAAVVATLHQPGQDTDLHAAGPAPARIQQSTRPSLLLLYAALAPQQVNTAAAIHTQPPCHDGKGPGDLISALPACPLPRC